MLVARQGEDLIVSFCTDGFTTFSVAVEGRRRWPRFFAGNFVPVLIKIWHEAIHALFLNVGAVGTALGSFFSLVLI